MSLDPNIFSPMSKRPSVRFAGNHLSRHPDATWGFAIVRTAYSQRATEQWDTVLQTIKDAIFAEVEWEVKNVRTIVRYMGISLEEKLRYWNAGPEGPFPPVDRKPVEFVKERLRLLVIDDDAQKGAGAGADAEVDADAVADHVREVFKQWARRQAEAGPEERLDTQVSHFTALFVDEEAVASVLQDGQKGFVGAVEWHHFARQGKYRWPGWLRVQLSTLYSFYTSAASVEGVAQDARKRSHTTAPVYDEERDDYDSEEFDVSMSENNAFFFSSLILVFPLCKNLTAYLSRASTMTP